MGRRAASVLTGGNEELPLNTHAGQFSSAGDAVAFENACSFAEYLVTVPHVGLVDENSLQLEGSLLRKNGFSNRAPIPMATLGERVCDTEVLATLGKHVCDVQVAQPLVAVQFARNRIDRRACSEFRLLGQLATLSGKAPRGNVRLFISRAPCISCIGVMVQFRRLCPGIALTVGFPGRNEHPSNS